MPFERCPECGDTNYAEDNDLLRSFDCGFESIGDKRWTRCEDPDPAARQLAVPEEIARYRLAFFDAGQLAEAIADDMGQQSGTAPFAERCRALARQLRQMAGDAGGSDTPCDPSGGGNGGKLLRLLPKTWTR